jgi:phage terminase large subunit
VTGTQSSSLERPKHPGGRPRRPLAETKYSALLHAQIVALLTELGKGKLPDWPSAHYRKRPDLFAREVLGVKPWAKQIEILESVRDYDKTAVKSGHKVGKSNSAVMVALWFYCSFPDARVVMTATTERQVDGILWRELRKVYQRAGRCVDCKKRDEQLVAKHQAPGPVPCPHSRLLGNAPREHARSGLKSADFREIMGFTAKESEAVAGISGANVLYLVDEASGVPAALFPAMVGNMAGGGKICLFSNPTQTEGEFFDAFYSKNDPARGGYKTISISSLESPNVVENRNVIPGLATRAWVDARKEEYGEDSPFYKVRVLGEFALNEDGRVVTIHLLEEAEKRWEDDPGRGLLTIGIDPAGPGGKGDESGFAVRRGTKVLAVFGKRGLSEEGHIVEVLQIIAEFRDRSVDREPPLVVVDREGPIGSALWGRLRQHAEQPTPPFVVRGVRSSDKARRQPQLYDRMRDELWANLAQWLREGGSIPSDVHLEKDLHAPEWKMQVTGRLKVSPKDDLRKALGRSPDRGDAVALAVWFDSDVGDDGPSTPPVPHATDIYETVDRPANPWDAVSFSGRR